MLKTLFATRSGAALESLTGSGPIIVTVHGTNDADPSDEGTRWWQRDSRFTTRLAARLDELGITGAQILPVHWSGANSDHDRLAAAQELSRLLMKLELCGRPHAVIGHSHGGNVVMEALGLSRLGRPLAGIITFGTPFFIRRLKSVARLIAAFQVLLGLVITPVMAWFLVSALMAGTSKWIEAIIVLGGLGIVAALSLCKGLFELTRSGWSRSRARRAIDPSSWLVVHSPRDEAMRLLETAAAISPSYVTVASSMRSLSRLSVVSGVVATIVFLTATWSYFLDPIAAKATAGEYGAGIAADLMFLLVLPIVYGAVVFTMRAAARLGGARLHAAILNAAIHGGLMGAAYGGDGRFKLTHVARTPPYVEGSQERRIDALDLGGINETSILASAQELYESVIAHEGGEIGLADPDKLWKRLSDALYHNAYMRDDQVIGSAAEHLAKCWRSQAEASS